MAGYTSCNRRTRVYGDQDRSAEQTVRLRTCKCLEYEAVVWTMGYWKFSSLYLCLTSLHALYACAPPTQSCTMQSSDSVLRSRCRILRYPMQLSFCPFAAPLVGGLYIVKKHV